MAVSIVADPRGDYRYFTYYMAGLEQVVGKGCVHYDVRPFSGLAYRTWFQLNSGMPVIVADGDKRLKIFFDTADKPQMHRDRYEWCDVYGKVNPYIGLAERYPKVAYLGPEFGLRLHDPLRLSALAMRNYLLCRRQTGEGLATFLRKYLYCYVRRRPLADYAPSSQVRENYVFHASTLWASSYAATYTTPWRGEFLRACQKAGMAVEGKLYYIGAGAGTLSQKPDYPKYEEEYKGFVCHKRIPTDEYIRKTKASTLVFNTPSVRGCHGWKLAEYLCMGKAIISTPLTRDLPCPLTHGENVHFVKTPGELYDAVVRINNDAEYRRRLEKGARAYYEQWVSPQAVIRRLLVGWMQKNEC